MWMTTALLLLAAHPTHHVAASSAVRNPAATVAGDARVAGSANFAVFCNSPSLDAREVAAQCEQWRMRLHDFWCGSGATTTWTPRCQIIVHPSKADYLAAVGPGAAQTLGTCSIEFSGRRVKLRRIDLLAQPGKPLSALAHEMTHVLFADLFDGRQPPRWVDEGGAILADAEDKQLLHQRDLRLGFERRHAFRCAELVALEDYPSRERVPTFYGQSASLVTFLAQREDPAKFVTFVQRAMNHGYDRALRDVYGIQGVGELEALWMASNTTARLPAVQVTLHEPPADLGPQGAE